MTSPVVAHVTVSCTPTPLSTPTAPHRVDIHADGSVTTLDHDNEPWAGSNHVEHALGGNFTWTPCDWWQAATTHDYIGTTMWNGQHLHPVPGSPEHYLTPSTWDVTPIDDWTLPAQHTTWVALGLIPPPIPHHTPSVSPLVVDTSGILPPEELLAACLRIARYSAAADWRGGVPVTALSRFAAIDEHLTTTYLRHGVPWHTVEGFCSLNVDADVAGRICAALQGEHGTGMIAFGGPEMFTANAMEYIPDPERVAALLEWCGPDPWLRQDLPRTREHLRTHLPADLQARLGEYTIAANTFEQLTSRDTATHMVYTLTKDVNPDPTQWTDTDIREHQRRDSP